MLRSRAYAFAQSRLRQTRLKPGRAWSLSGIIPLPREDLQHMNDRPHPDLGSPPRRTQGGYAGLSNTCWADMIIIDGRA